MIRETCSCSASIEFDPRNTTVVFVEGWRENHKHEVEVAHWKFKYEQCNFESSRRREKINELKAQLILNKKEPLPENPDTPPSAEKPDNAYKRGRLDEREMWTKVAEDRYHDLSTCTKDDACKTKADGVMMVLEDAECAIEQESANADTAQDVGECRQVGDSLAPSQPSAYDYDEGYCDCWRCDDSCQNSTENGMVVTANANNPGADGERRQDEPPVGTPVWWDGKWWTHRNDEAYYYTGLSVYGRAWDQMPGAVAALTPLKLATELQAESDMGRRRGREAAAGEYYDKGYVNGREDAAKAVEDVKLLPYKRVCAIPYKDAVRAARGEK